MPKHSHRAMMLSQANSTPVERAAQAANDAATVAAAAPVIGLATLAAGIAAGYAGLRYGAKTRKENIWKTIGWYVIPAGIAAGAVQYVAANIVANKLGR
jgi:hypothetical protein